MHVGTPQISYFPVCIRVELEEHNLGHWADFGSCWLRTARQFSHAYAGKADQKLPLAFSLSTWHSQYVMQILTHQSLFADTVRPSKKMFLVRRASERASERASGRKKSVVNSVYLKERHGAYCFSTLSCERYLRAALFGLTHGNRIVFFERVPRNVFVSDFNLKRYSFEKYTVLTAF